MYKKKPAGLLNVIKKHGNLAPLRSAIGIMEYWVYSAFG